MPPVFKDAELDERINDIAGQEAPDGTRRERSRTCRTVRPKVTAWKTPDSSASPTTTARSAITPPTRPSMSPTSDDRNSCGRYSNSATADRRSRPTADGSCSPVASARCVPFDLGNPARRRRTPTRARLITDADHHASGGPPRPPRRAPNFIYTCGAVARHGTLVVPYGIADQTFGSAMLSITEVLDAMTPEPPKFEKQRHAVGDHTHVGSRSTGVSGVHDRLFPRWHCRAAREAARHADHHP